MMVIMRYPAGHKEEMRARILASASRALRAKGLGGVSIPALMKEAGLTHGGFYGYFENRDALVAEAVEHASGETFGRLTEHGVVEGYLHPWHVSHPEHGCVVATLGAEAAREPTKTRRAMSQAAERLVLLVAGTRGREPVGEDALVRACTMVGAVVLARALGPGELGKRVLEAARRASTAPVD